MTLVFETLRFLRRANLATTPRSEINVSLQFNETK